MVNQLYSSMNQQLLPQLFSLPLLFLCVCILKSILFHGQPIAASTPIVSCKCWNTFCTTLMLLVIATISVTVVSQMVQAVYKLQSLLQLCHLPLLSLLSNKQSYCLSRDCPKTDARRLKCRL